MLGQSEMPSQKKSKPLASVRLKVFPESEFYEGWRCHEIKENISVVECRFLWTHTGKRGYVEMSR